MNDPIVMFSEWYREASRDAAFPAETVALATATADGKPSVRFVYFRGIREGGFSFFTNYESRKGQELAANPFASLAFYWPSVQKQVRVEGRVGKLSAAESDAYWRSRAIGSQVSAAASRQSRPLNDDSEFLAEIARVEKAVGSAVPRPDHWGGYKMVPNVIEFWIHGEHRRHWRLRFEKTGEGWTSLRLYP
jgi:pyridoxamine 5'-phosphate oxidase